jgi:hypothetical protein
MSLFAQFSHNSRKPVSVVMPFRGYKNPSSWRTRSAPMLDSL